MKNKKNPGKDNENQGKRFPRFLFILGLLFVAGFGAKGLVSVEPVIDGDEGYRSNVSGILYDYSPARFQSALGSGEPTLLDFSADWCPPCRVTAPILEKLREEYDGRFNIMTANADLEQDLVIAYREEWYPSFIFFNENGEEVRRIRGLIFEEDFRLAIEELLEKDSYSLDIKTISAEEVLERMKKGERLNLIDVRTPEEYRMGHIPGSVLIPLSTLQEGGFEGINLNKGAEIIVYCQGGVRSRRAARILRLVGFRNVKDMGGILDWSQRGGPIVSS
jgi:rhodanese-related sulfurtransferase